MQIPKDVLQITAKTFKKYGKLIEYPKKESKGTKRNLWRIVHSQSNNIGWRVAYLVLRDKTIRRLESHPDSDETFEPIRGRALFFVSETMKIEDIKCFLLDKAVIINKGIWHGLVSIDAEVEIKIFENATVTCEYWRFKARIKTLEEVRNKWS